MLTFASEDTHPTGILLVLIGGKLSIRNGPMLVAVGFQFPATSPARMLKYQRPSPGAADVLFGVL